MLRWISERLDDSLFPLLKLASPGYRRRLPPYRPAETFTLHELGDLCPPEAVGLFEEPAWHGYRVEGYCFPSPVATQSAENGEVHGRLLTADPRGPWTLVVPGYATGSLPPGKYSVFQELQGLALLKRGINVALIDLPFHVNRRRRGRISGEGFFSPDLGETGQAVRQSVADAICVIRWLEARSGRPVALWGTSLGGCVAGLVATRLANLAAVALMEPLDNPGSVLAALPATGDIREALRNHGIGAEDMEEALRPVAPSSYLPAIARERLLFATPLWDRIVPTRFQDHFWEAWGKPRRILCSAGHVTMAASRTLNTQIGDFLSRWVLYPTL